MTRRGNGDPNGNGNGSSFKLPFSQWAVTRRDFIKVAGVGGTALLAEGCAFVPVLVPEWSVTLTRPRDLVKLKFEFAGLDLQDGTQGKELVTSSSSGWIIVHFAPQHFLEQAVGEAEVDGGDPVPLPPVNALISGPSRIVLKVPNGHPPIPYTSAGLLEALRTLEMSVAPNATPPDSERGLSTPGGFIGAPRAQAPALPQVRPRQPVNGETAIELPFRLQISPNYHARWRHALAEAEGLKSGRNELWHTRLGTLSSPGGVVTEGPHSKRTVRAIWTRDYDMQVDEASSYAEDPYKFVPNNPSTASFGPQSLIANERGAIVQQSSNYLDWPTDSDYVPRPIDADQLMLTSMGGWLKAHADFGLDAPLFNVISWDHLASMGRDYFVKVVKRGRLFPWGNLAILIKISERKFRGPDATIAYLWQRWFIQILEPERTYPGTWRGFPFGTVRFKTLVTPNLNIPNQDDDTEPKPIRTAPGEQFRFKMEGVDRDGKLVKFDATAVWVPDNPAFDASSAEVQLAAAMFRGQAPAPVALRYSDADRTSPLSSQRVAFAKNNKADDATYETANIIWDSVLDNEPTLAPFPTSAWLFAPRLKQAQLNVEAVRHLLGQENATPFEYHAKYVEHGLPDPGETGHSNQGEILFGIVGGAVTADFKKKQNVSGGFVDPTMSFSGLSRKTQLASDLDNAASGNFDPTQFIPDARIFGVVKLSDILPLGDIAKDAPNFVTQALDVVRNFFEDGNALSGMAGQLKQKLVDAGNGALAAAQHLQTLADEALDLIAAVQALISTATSNPDDLDDEIAALTAPSGAFDQFNSALDAVIADADSLPDVLRSEKEDLKRRAAAVKNMLNAVKDGLKAFATGLEMVKNLTVKFEWRTPVQGDSLGFFVPGDDPEGGFLLAVEARGKQVGDNPPGFSVVAGIENFTINVFGSDAKLVAIPFKHILFKIESNRKPEIDVVFAGDLGFDGILAFIKTLAELIPGDGFSDPPAIEVDAEGIRASFSVPIPSIAVGVFALQNIRIGAGFEVPFIGNPLSISFFFCTREEPFVLTVMMVGGGGFVGLKISTEGMLLLEAAFEARAQLAIDFGVASGSISIAVGVYFRLEKELGPPKKDVGEITGYLRFQGKVDVLGLISASITLLLEFTYEFESKKLVGRATLTIEVSIFFFSFSVELSVERKLAGSGDDPTFLDQMKILNEGTPEQYDPWAEYLSSFALAA